MWMEGWKRFVEWVRTLEASGVTVDSSRPAEALAAILKLALTVLGSGSGSPGCTVRRAVVVQVSPTERVPSAFELVMKGLVGSRRLPRRLSLTAPLTSAGESA